MNVPHLYYAPLVDFFDLCYSIFSLLKSESFVLKYESLSFDSNSIIVETLGSDLQSANNEERHGLGASKQRYQVQENQQTYDDVVNNHHSMARESFDDWRNKQNQDVLLDDGKFSKRSKVGNNG